MLDIMAGMDQKDSCEVFGGVAMSCGVDLLFWLCLLFCMGQRYADEGKYTINYIQYP